MSNEMPAEIIKGVEFEDKACGPMLLKEFHGKAWLFIKHPDGQWITYRTAMTSDLAKLGYFGWQV